MHSEYGDPAETFTFMMTKIGYKPDALDTPGIYGVLYDITEMELGKGYRTGLEWAYYLQFVGNENERPKIDDTIPIIQQVNRFILDHLL